MKKGEEKMDAPERAKEIKAAVAAVIAFLTTLWGWLGWAIFLWICCILLDYIAGSLAAKKEKNWSSDIARAGLWHKLGEIFAVTVAAMCDIALKVIAAGAGINLPFEIGPLLTPIVLLWYVLTEIGSIIENCGKLGAPVPSWFKEKIDHYKDTIDASGEGQGAHLAEHIQVGPEIKDPDDEV